MSTDRDIGEWFEQYVTDHPADKEAVLRFVRDMAYRGFAVAPEGSVVPCLKSTHEVARTLRVKPQTVHTWRARGILPEPDFSLRVGPVWLCETIERWAIETGRWPKHASIAHLS